MYDWEREKALWKQSGARYRVTEEKRKERKADTFEADTVKRKEKQLPVHLAALENEYGNVEFSRQKDGSLTVSFAKKQEFQEPVFQQEEEKLHQNRLVMEQTGSMTHMRNSGSPHGAEAFVLSKEKSAAKQVKQIVKGESGALEQMARSMASLLIPVSHDVMPEVQMDMMTQDLIRTARHAAEISREKTEAKERGKKEDIQYFRLIKKSSEGNGEEGENSDIENEEADEAPEITFSSPEVEK